MKNRIIYGALLIVLMLVCVFLSPATRILFFTVAGCLCAWEYSHQMEKLHQACSLYVMILYLIAQAVLAILHASLAAYCALFIGAVYLAMLSGILRKKVNGNGALDTVAGLTYPCLLFGVIVVISVSNIWLETLAIACLATWSCDNGAFMGGRRYGKHKLAPAISPNKTVEGALIGAAATIPIAVLVYYLGIWCTNVPWLGDQYSIVPLGLCIVTCLVASTMGQIGDLAESLMKRMIGVKDFSNLIPGHGGLLVPRTLADIEGQRHSVLRNIVAGSIPRTVFTQHFLRQVFEGNR